MITKRSVVAMVLLTVMLGALVALPLGRNREISVEVWLTSAALWLAALTAKRIFNVAPIATDGLRRIWGRSQDPVEPPVRLPTNLQALEGAVIGGRDSPRGFAQRLQPRLIEIVHHGLETKFGVDMEQNPARAAGLLGEHAWLVDQEATDRVADLDQVNQLLDLVATDRPERTSE